MLKEPKKEIVIERSKKTGWWTWRADWYNESDEWMCGTEGYGSSKRDARRRGKDAECPCCDNLKVANPLKKISIEPPFIDVEVVNGYLCNFTTYNTIGEKIKFSTSEISDNVAYWFFGIDCFDNTLSKKSDIVIAMLKIWGVYKGGKTQIAICKIHNLSDKYFNIIADKTWKTINIKFDEKDNLFWHITV